ncbi:DNA topoisomerase [Favolaschia claudopus]|uniref:DNA topoisomerase (ATP-hydrolyzing) n=1 Tax=Favolaschia claudopus TaxID=2862362 RepID=A0AAW0EL59_9AGAR
MPAPRQRSALTAFFWRSRQTCPRVSPSIGLPTPAASSALLSLNSTCNARSHFTNSISPHRGLSPALYSVSHHQPVAVVPPTLSAPTRVQPPSTCSPPLHTLTAHLRHRLHLQTRRHRVRDYESPHRLPSTTTTSLTRISSTRLDDFLVESVTPIVRVTRGEQRKDFFTIPEYEQWSEDTPGSNKWDVKYYKGSGTSKDSDAREYFSHMEKHMIPFASTQEGDRDLIELAMMDGMIVEPERCMHVLPLVLLGSALTPFIGWSTNIPCFNPVEIVDNLPWLMWDEEMVLRHPSWRDFTGEIWPRTKNKYDDDNMDIDDAPSPPEIEVVKPPSKKAKGKAIDSDDEDFDEAPKAKGKAKAAPKRKSLDSALDSDDEPPKKKKSSRAQAVATDFFAKARPSGSGSSEPEQRKTLKSMKPVSPPEPRKAPLNKLVDTPDEEDMYDFAPAAPAR